METLEAIKTRRSIRKFKKEPISRDTVKKLLEAAMFAPSAGNEQPWQFIVLDDRKILDDVPKICSTAAMCRQATAAVLVCGDAGLEKYPEFWVQDCSAAVENLLLAAHAMGLGAVWAGIYPLKDRVEGFRKLFSLSDDITPFALVPLGYPDQEIATQKRYKEERIHYNGW
jgi:nitroreductase